MITAESGEPPEVRAAAAERLTFFADAVIAIAVTLLALELPVPSGVTNADLLHSAYEHRQEYLAFVISFLVISVQWRSHHQTFRHVAVVSPRLTGLTLGWLFLQVITPFATKVITGDGGFQFRFGFYALVEAAAFVMFVLMVREIRRSRLYREGTPPEALSRPARGAGMMAVAFGISIPLSFVTGWAYVAWIVPRALASILFRRRKNRSPETGSTAADG
ncbi:DUF1211 domain-containing protein [Amycolatopsis rhizosphaerae]|uniref:DUF1211 domain-containing protein n=1 Tax=Amycolatopsis rhizosphaerae TaxID=2053003 RepID=A0A558BFL7_9PSEU|nr:TMEM175 family protein [Amycolatopsis rhizosphaerae]TVT35304.1 DUF1211 domain-containing protein [Amycolatopsis rhizosphaerae]